ncbi:MAG TPA: type II secretion system protein [Candidatus Saccharimonadaceae bacterium]|nr:type II secretion system protein [Candidatus Saccharimonadaceae bacterium]
MFSKRGFTMIEMMLSMTFVSFLMITIALTSVSMARTYQRGVTLSEVNAAGRAIITDMQRTISQAPVVVQGQTVFQHTPNSICFSSYSYVWNSGYDIANHAGSLITYTGGDTTTHPINGNNVVRLAKVYDPSNHMCTTPPTSVSVTSGNVTELLPSDSSSGTSYNGIAIQNTGGSTGSGTGITAIQLDKGDSSTTQALYQVTFIVGTNDQSSLSSSNFGTAPSCQPPANNPTGLEYCAVNRFSFLVRAGGGSDVAS